MGAQRASLLPLLHEGALAFVPDGQQLMAGGCADQAGVDHTGKAHPCSSNTRQPHPQVEHWVHQAETACRQHAGGASPHIMPEKDGAALFKVIPGQLGVHLEG